MKSIYLGILCATALTVSVFASHADEDSSSKRIPTLYLEEGDYLVDREKNLQGRLYRESTLAEAEANALKMILLDPKGNDAYTYHKGIMSCLIANITGDVPSCLKDDGRPTFINFSAPHVSRRNIPDSYDWTVRYDHEGQAYFFILRLIDNVMKK